MDEKLNAALKSLYDAFTDEQKERAKQCKTADELVAFAGKEGVKLPDDLMDLVVGGFFGKSDPKSNAWRDQEFR